MSEEIEVLLHTSRTGRYVTGDPAVIQMSVDGLLHDHGAQRLVAGDHYFTLTSKGEDAIREWRASQPKPPKPTRSQLRWQEYRRVSDIFTFPQWLKLQKERNLP